MVRDLLLSKQKVPVFVLFDLKIFFFDIHVFRFDSRFSCRHVETYSLNLLEKSPAMRSPVVEGLTTCTCANLEGLSMRTTQPVCTNCPLQCPASVLTTLLQLSRG